MATKTPEQLHLAAVASLGCCICRRPAQAHHLRGLESGTGTGLKASDFETIPLCPDHHTDGGPGIAYHAAPETWEDKYGTQLYHLEETRKRLSKRISNPFFTQDES